MTLVRTSVALLATIIFMASPARAHPKLVSSVPAAGSVAGSTDRVSLTFSEPLLLPLSNVTLTMTGKPGAMSAGQAMHHAQKSLSGDGKTLTTAFPHRLLPGAYDLAWQVVGADTHRLTGKISFTIK